MSGKEKEKKDCRVASVCFFCCSIAEKQLLDCGQRKASDFSLARNHSRNDRKRSGEFFVEDYCDEDGCEDQEHVAEGETPERAGGVGELQGDWKVVLPDDLGCFGGIEGDHGIMAATGADAEFDSEKRKRVEEGDGEDDSSREPELVLEDAGEGEDEGDHPEGGFGLHAAVGGGVLIADVEAAGAEFLHSRKDNRWDCPWISVRVSRAMFEMTELSPQNEGL